MISTEISERVYKNLSSEQQLMLALYSDFDDDAKKIYDLLQNVSEATKTETPAPSIETKDGVYYLYEDGTCELFDYNKKNEPQKPVKRIGVIMGSHSIAVSLNDYDEQPLFNTDDPGEYEHYIKEYEDAVADWSGLENTEYIKRIGTNIPLQDDEWLPSVAELYLIYFNKRAINAAIRLAGGSPIQNGWYWTSSQFSATYAWHLSLGDGGLGSWGTKVTPSLYVRAVAAFH